MNTNCPNCNSELNSVQKLYAVYECGSAYQNGILYYQSLECKTKNLYLKEIDVIDAIQEAIGNWGGPQREMFNLALSKIWHEMDKVKRYKI